MMVAVQYLEEVKAAMLELITALEFELHELYGRLPLSGPGQ